MGYSIGTVIVWFIIGSTIGLIMGTNCDPCDPWKMRKPTHCTETQK